MCLATFLAAPRNERKWYKTVYVSQRIFVTIKHPTRDMTCRQGGKAPLSRGELRLSQPTCHGWPGPRTRQPGRIRGASRQPSPFSAGQLNADGPTLPRADGVAARSRGEATAAPGSYRAPSGSGPRPDGRRAHPPQTTIVRPRAASELPEAGGPHRTPTAKAPGRDPGTAEQHQERRPGEGPDAAETPQLRTARGWRAGAHGPPQPAPTEPPATRRHATFAGRAAAFPRGQSAPRSARFSPPPANGAPAFPWRVSVCGEEGAGLGSGLVSGRGGSARRGAPP